MASPIVWDWYKEKVDITVQINSVATVISKDLPIQNLEVLYSGKKVEALNRVSIQIENTGRTPITSSDVIKPIELKFSDSEIIEAKIVAFKPSNLEITLSKLEPNKLLANFSLLNPNDKATIDILLLGLTAKFEAKARIKNVDEINIIDNIGIKEGNPPSHFFFPMLILALIILWIGLAEMLPNWPKKLSAYNMLLNASHPIYNVKSYDEVLKNLFEEQVFSSKQQEYILMTFLKLNFPIAAHEKKKIRNDISKQVFFKKQTLIIDFLVELFLVLLFG